MGDICSYHCIGFILPFLHRIPQLAFKGLLPQSLGNMAAGTLGFPLRPPPPTAPLAQMVIFFLPCPVFVSALSFPVTEDTFLQGASETGGGSCCSYLSVQRAKERFYQSRLRNCLPWWCLCWLQRQRQ